MMLFMSQGDPAIDWVGTPGFILGDRWFGPYDRLKGPVVARILFGDFLGRRNRTLEYPLSQDLDVGFFEFFAFVLRRHPKV